MCSLAIQPYFLLTCLAAHKGQSKMVGRAQEREALIIAALNPRVTKVDLSKLSKSKILDKYNTGKILGSPTSSFLFRQYIVQVLTWTSSSSVHTMSPEVAI